MNNSQPLTSGAQHAGIHADNESFCFKRIFLAWDKDVVPITSTLHTANRYGQARKTGRHKENSQQLLIGYPKIVSMFGNIFE